MQLNLLIRRHFSPQSEEASILWSHHEETREFPGEMGGSKCGTWKCETKMQRWKMREKVFSSISSVLFSTGISPSGDRGSAPGSRWGLPSPDPPFAPLLTKFLLRLWCGNCLLMITRVYKCVWSVKFFESKSTLCARRWWWTDELMLYAADADAARRLKMTDAG